MKIKLNDILTQAKNSEYIEHPEKEKFVTVSGHGQGVKERIIGDGKTPVKFNGYRVKQGQLIYSRIGASDGAFGIVPISLNNAVVSKDFPVFDVDSSKASIDYLIYYLTSDLFCHTASRESFGATMTRFKEDKLLDCEIELPSLGEQLNIVNVLSDVKRMVLLHQKELQKLDDLIKARFVELFGNPDKNEKEWDIFKMNQLCEVGSSKRIYQNEQSMEGIPFLRISDLVNRMDTGSKECDLFIPVEKYQELKDKELVPLPGDILLTARGTLGRCYIVKDDDEFYFQDGMITWLYDFDERITAKYIEYLFMMAGFRKQIDALQAGSTVAYLSISMTKELDIMLPPLELQEEFIAFVKQVDKSKAVVQKALEKSQLLFDSLMQEYFG